MLPEASSGQARLFSRPAHKDSEWLEMFTGFVAVVPDSVSCYPATLKALLFRLAC